MTLNALFEEKRTLQDQLKNQNKTSGAMEGLKANL